MAHSDSQALLTNIERAKKLVTVGCHYRHYRTGGSYLVLEVGLQEQTQQVCVVYQSESDGLIWVRNLDDWLSSVQTESGETIPRFIKLFL